MAKFEPRLGIKRILGGLQEYVYPNTAFKRQGIKFSRNQYGLNLGKKAGLTTKTTKAQEFARGRFGQVQCMYSSLTDWQMEHFRIRQQIWTDYQCSELMRLQDCFTSLGMTYNLRWFLAYNLKLQLDWELKAEGYDLTAKIKYKTFGSKERYYYIDGEWIEVPIDRSHLKYGSTRITADMISPNPKPGYAHAYFTALGGEEQEIEFRTGDFDPPLPPGKYLFWLDHERFFSDKSYEVTVT